jgi:hypothetical protein
LQVDESSFVVGTDLTGVKTILPLSGSFEQLLDSPDEPVAAPAPGAPPSPPLLRFDTSAVDRFAQSGK